MVADAKVSQLRKRISELASQKRELINLVISGKPMILGLPYKFYRTCGNPNCKCAKGQKHGPFYVLQVHKDGKRKIIAIRREEEKEVVEKAKRYQRFSKAMAEMVKIDKALNSLLQQYKALLTKEFQRDEDNKKTQRKQVKGNEGT
jgi:hypothetical protein